MGARSTGRGAEPLGVPPAVGVAEVVVVSGGTTAIVIVVVTYAKVISSAGHASSLVARRPWCPGSGLIPVTVPSARLEPASLTRYLPLITFTG
jgi:hypothetical protein